MEHIIGICSSYGESLSTVLGECCHLARREDPHGAKEAVSTAFDTMIQAKGVKKAYSELLSEEAWDSRVEAMRVPGWINLLFKLRSRSSNSILFKMFLKSRLFVGRSRLSAEGTKC